MNVAQVERAAGRAGLISLGAIRALPRHGAPEGVGAVVLLGLSHEGWAIFTGSPEFADGAPDPMDRWSSRVIGDLGAALQAEAMFPFGGPPYQPFMRWAAATGRMWPSPLGMSVHDEHGLWMSFRGALGFGALDDVPDPDPAPDLDLDPASTPAPRPCDTCISQPCLKACPVDAFRTGVGGTRYDVDACAAHVRSPEGAACRQRGCLARRACWIGQDWVLQPDRAAFHMGAFLRARDEK